MTLRGNDSLGAGWQFRKFTQTYVVAYLENAAVVDSQSDAKVNHLQLLVDESSIRIFNRVLVHYLCGNDYLFNCLKMNDEQQLKLIEIASKREAMTGEILNKQVGEAIASVTCTNTKIESVFFHE